MGSPSIQTKKKEQHIPFFDKERVEGVLSKSQQPFFSPNGAADNGPTPFFNKGGIQTKLTIGQPGDKYEQEADVMADQVVQRLNAPDTLQSKPSTPASGSVFTDTEKYGPWDEEVVESNSELRAKNEEEPLQEKSYTGKTSDQLQGNVGNAGNHSGLPHPLKAGLEALSGMDLSGVRVHKNSSKSAQVNAFAYTQGQDIHVGPGQEKHLPHEGWHAVQQMQGRVKPTMQVNGVLINDYVGLEREADVMGAKASLQEGGDKLRSRRQIVCKAPTNQPTVQRSVTGEAPLPGGGVTAPTKWRMEMTGVAKMTGSGPAQTKPIADTVIFDPGPTKTVKLSGVLTFKQYEYRKSWRWGDPKWRRRSMDIPFDYSAYFIGTTIDGTAKVKFSSDTKRKLELAGITLYEIEPSSSGDTGLIKAKAYYSSNSMEVSTAIKLQPPKKVPEIKIGPIYIEREVTIDNFPISKETVSPQNFKKVENFWLSLTPETRKAIQDDKMLNNSKVQIIGYTSNTDMVTNNFELGYKRAMAVRDILMKLSGNGVGTNLAAMSEHERAVVTDDPKKEHEDATQRKVKIVLWQLPSPE
jgi:hypothetical protein